MINPNQKIAWLVIDDCLDFIKNLTQITSYQSIFDEPTLKFYKQMYDSYGAVTELALFYTNNYKTSTQETLGWTLSDATDKWKSEFEANSHWLKMSFHSWSVTTRYLHNRNDITSEFDFSRSLVDDYYTIKNEVVRFAGESSWIGNTVFHYYDNKKNEVDQLALDGEIDLIVAHPRQISSRGVSGYLNSTQQKELHDTGYYLDTSNGVLFTIRDVALERINGTLRIEGLPKRTIDFLDYYNNPSKPFMNPETHEVQIINGISDKFPVKRELNDLCAWCNMRGYTWKFPTKSDFNII